jgi:ribosomal protein S18 acetylase RimI-like enzyme
MRVERLTHRAAIRAFLERDRQLTAYALGDLDDHLWPESEFYGALVEGVLQAVLLLYRGLEPTVLTAFGTAEGLRALMQRVALPLEVYYLWLPEHAAILAEQYSIPTGAHEEWRMVLPRARFDPPSLNRVVPVAPGHAGDLAELYRHAAAPGEEVVAFSPAQIARGRFFGVWRDGRLVATAGTHVWSPQEGVAAIGNVFTHPAYRGHGYATQCTAAVAQAAFDAGIETVVLNVRRDNSPALRVYEKLGFQRYALFLEGPALKRGR